MIRILRVFPLFIIIASCFNNDLNELQRKEQEVILLKLTKKDIQRQLIHPESAVFLDSTATYVPTQIEDMPRSKAWKVQLEIDSETLGAGIKRFIWTLIYRQRRNRSPLKGSSYQLIEFDSQLIKE